MEAQDIMDVRQYSRRTWHAVLHAFDPPPVVVIRPPWEQRLAEPEGSSGLGRQTAREVTRPRRPRYGKIGYGSGPAHAEWQS